MAHGALWSAFELIREYGTRTTEKACTCCGKFTLYAISYPEGDTVVLLCSMCDVERDKWA